MTKYFYENILLSMRVFYNTVSPRKNTTFIYSGLDSISDEGREYLKKLAKSLVAIQNRPGTPIPDSVCQEILQGQTEEVL